MKTTFLFCAFFLIVFGSFCQAQIPNSNPDSAPGPLYELKRPENLYVKGQIEAERNYTKYKGAGTGTLLTSLVSPLVGLIPAIACSATPPKLSNLGYPDEELFKQQEYYLGYTEKAKRIKKRKVWTNWGIGLGVNIVAVVLLNSGR